MTELRCAPGAARKPSFCSPHRSHVTSMTNSAHSEHDRWMMREAITESRNALPGCRPNPPVGCVIVCDSTVVARGFTNPPGSPHAEAMALACLTVPQREVSVYVTLEPCSFHGRTPSCAMALAAARVRRVYVGMLDPDPRNRGNGIEILRNANVEVILGVLADEVEAFLGPHLMRAHASNYACGGTGTLQSPVRFTTQPQEGR
jgi:pyrimidine deaminase RibD-like protein